MIDFKNIEEQIAWLCLKAETPDYMTMATRQRYSDTAKSMQSLRDVAKAAALSQNYGPDSTDQDWDDFWRGLESALAELHARGLVEKEDE